MDSKSAIEIIFTLEEKIDKIMAKIDLLEVNISNLNNKVYVLNSKVSDMSIRETQSFDGGASRARSASASTPESNPVSSLVLGNVKVFGYVLNKSKMPINNVYIRIFASNNSVIKETSTDKNGYWECRLPSGNFGVEYTHKNFKPVNRPLEVPEGVNSFEVK